MRLSIKPIKISTGGPLIALMNDKDAEILDLHNGDRIEIFHKKKSLVIKIDITTSSILETGKLGLFEEAHKKLGGKTGDPVRIQLAEKPKSIAFIREKMNGHKLSYKKIRTIVQEITENKIDDVELTYFVAACHTRLLDNEETVNLTKAMIETGDRLHFPKNRPVIDKHCIGGVAGNRTTMILVPIVSAADLLIPKTSSRSITSPAGTADTMECIANVSFSIEHIRKVLKRVGACIVWGGAINLAPADDRIIRVEHPLSIDSRSQLIASILAKKASVSSTHVLVDIPVGKGAKIEDMKDARSLAAQFRRIGRSIGMRVEVIITDGSRPIGMGFGPALEARDVLKVLRNDPDAPADLREKSLMMAGKIFEMTKITARGSGKKLARKILDSGRAMEKFTQMVEAQGIKTLDPEKIPIGKFKHVVRAPKRGMVAHIDNLSVSKIARIAGAPKDAGAGLQLHVKKSETVKKGQPLFSIHSNNRQRLKFAIDLETEFHAVCISRG
ncbi:MAG: AMP phosphorylase [archaeon]